MTSLRDRLAAYEKAVYLGDEAAIAHERSEVEDWINNALRVAWAKGVRHGLVTRVEAAYGPEQDKVVKEIVNEYK